MTANVGLSGDVASGATVVPLPSIYQTPDGRPAVWIYDANGGKVSLRPVVIAQYREDGVVIASGVATGEWVVAAGANKLHEDQPVRPYEAPGHAVPMPAAATNPAAPKG